MAVLDGVPGLEVVILVDGTPLQEYVDQDEEVAPGKTTKYIEAISNSRFKVRYSITTPFNWKHDLKVRLLLDGTCVSSQILDKLENSSGCIETIKGLEERDGEKYYRRRFVFSQLDIEEDEQNTCRPGLNLNDVVQNLGCISFQAYWAQILATEEAIESKTTHARLRTVPEKALKGRAISHETSLSEGKRISPFKSVKHKTFDEAPFATFQFKYRSKEALKALRIISRTPSPVPLEDRDIDTLTLEETRELLRRQRERERAERVKKEEGAESIKRERPSGSETLGGNEDDDEVSIISEKRRRTSRRLESRRR